MSQRKPKAPATKKITDINDIKTEEDLQEFFSDNTSPLVQELLELHREQIARGDKPLTEEEIRYEINLAKHGKQVADALRENETLKDEVENLKQQVKALKRLKDAA